MIKNKLKFWTGTAILLLLLMAVLFGMFRFELDLAMALWAIAGLLVAFVILVIVQYRLAPKKKVEVVTKVSLKAPPRMLRKWKNYRLDVSTVKHIEEKGLERTVQMDEVHLSFSEKDHPDAYAYCMQVVTRHMEENLALARRSHPDAEVISSELVLPPDLKQIGPSEAEA